MAVTVNVEPSPKAETLYLREIPDGNYRGITEDGETIYAIANIGDVILFDADVWVAYTAGSTSLEADSKSYGKIFERIEGDISVKFHG